MKALATLSLEPRAGLRGIPFMYADNYPPGFLKLFPRHLISDEENLLGRSHFLVFICPPDLQAGLCAEPEIIAWV